MKTLLSILFLFLAVTLSAQYTAKYNGKNVVYNGSFMKIQADDIPTSPENPGPGPDPEWEDSVSFTTLYHEDWQDFPITNTLTSTFPNGIHDDTVAAHLLNFHAVASDVTTQGHGDPDYASNLDVVEMDGVKVIRSWYLQYRCCTGALSDEDILTDPTTDPNYIGGGTGGQLEMWISSPKAYYSRFAFYQWVWFPSAMDQFGLFENSDGFKMPGPQVDRVSYETHGSSRIMILDYSAGTSLDPAYYNSAWWDNWTETYVVANTKTKAPYTWFTPGWHLVTYVIDAGTAQGYNGWQHLYVDGKLIDDGANGGIRNSIPWLNAGETGFSFIEWSTFMGGNFDAYMSPKTQVLHFGPISVVLLPNYDTTPAPGQDVYVPKFIKELLTWE